MSWYGSLPGVNLLTGQGLDRGKNEFRGVDERGYLQRNADQADAFAGAGEQQATQARGEMNALGTALWRQAQGQDSIAQEQLRQGLQQGVSAQQAMAASASPTNASAAAYHAANNMGRMSSGMSGQAALARMQEQQAAQRQFGDLYSQMRQQDLQQAMQSRQNALTGYGDYERQRTARFGALMQAPTQGELQLGGALGVSSLPFIGGDDKKKS